MLECEPALSVFDSFMYCSEFRTRYCHFPVLAVVSFVAGPAQEHIVIGTFLLKTECLSKPLASGPKAGGERKPLREVILPHRGRSAFT
jgi:hypothetical protein